MTVTEYLAEATTSAASELLTAYERIPADKRLWTPSETSRSAASQMAEIAMLNGSTADTINARGFKARFGLDDYYAEQRKLAQDNDAILQMLHESVPAVAAAIKAVSDDELAQSIEMPWGPMTLQQVLGYPMWNMNYHEGQINYIASILGLLN